MSLSSIVITQGTGTNIAAHSISEAGSTKLIERTAPGTGTVEVSGADPDVDGQSTAGLYPASGAHPIDVTGLGRIVIRTSFDQPSATQEFRIQLYDINDLMVGVLPSVSEVYTSVASATEKDTLDKFIGSFFVFNNDGGICGLRIRLTDTTSSGSVYFHVAGV